METKLEKKYSIRDVAGILFKRLWIVILCAVIGASGAYYGSVYLIDKTYTASVSLYAGSESKPIDVYASLSELTYAQEAVNTYIEILKTNTFMREVADASGLRYSSGELINMIEIAAVNKTEIFRATVTTTSAKDSYILANTFAKLAPLKIMEIKSTDVIRVVDKATLPVSPSSPDLMMNTIIGTAAGILMGIIIALILEVLNKRVEDEEDLTKHYDVPILGRVPVIK